MLCLFCVLLFPVVSVIISTRGHDMSFGQYSGEQGHISDGQKVPCRDHFLGLNSPYIGYSFQFPLAQKKFTGAHRSVHLVVERKVRVRKFI